MKTFFVRAIKAFAMGSALLFSIGSLAQEIAPPAEAPKPIKDIGSTYKVTAGATGWMLTLVNQYSLRTESEDEAYQTSLLAHSNISVSRIDYKGLGLKPAQIQELEANLRNGQALLAGNLVTRPAPDHQQTKVLDARAAWISPTKSQAIGPYLKVSSSGIVCITTPCPYFTVRLINSTYTVNYDALIFDRAELDQEQEAQAWKAVSSDGLVLTGVRFFPEQETGVATGISTTKVFFPFPAKKSVRP